MEQLLINLSCKKILIDHHREPQTESFDYGISDYTKSSTAEMIFDFIMESGGEQYLDKDIAVSLYAGVMADTGSFRFSSTTTNVHLMVAKLKTFNIDHPKIHTAVYDNFLDYSFLCLFIYFPFRIIFSSRV
jgi:phosphoesterase RecJ-like protein